MAERELCYRPDGSFGVEYHLSVVEQAVLIIGMKRLDISSGRCFFPIEEVPDMEARMESVGIKIIDYENN